LLAFALSVAIPILALMFRTDGTKQAASTRVPTRPVAPVSSHPVTVDAASAQRSAMVAWAERNLDHEAAVVSDRATVALLRASGFRDVISFAHLGQTPVATVDYGLFVPGAVPGSAPAGDAAARLRNLSLPVALFGPAQPAASARQVFPHGTATAVKRQVRDGALQRSGGQQLLTNPAVRPDATTRAALLAGSIDLRVENVLALLATSTTLYVTDPVAEPAETRAGLPVRSVVVTTVGSQQAQDVQNTLSTLTVPYRPDIEDISPRKFRLIWQPAVAPATSIGG
jgi:hypothetical protein